MNEQNNDELHDSLVIAQMAIKALRQRLEQADINMANVQVSVITERIRIEGFFNLAQLTDYALQKIKTEIEKVK